MPAVYVPENKVAFIHIPKTAGMSVTKWMEENFNVEKVNGHPAIHHLNWDIQNNFIIVRNPWERVVSGYMYFKTAMNSMWEMNNIQTFPTFKHFILNPPTELNVIMDEENDPHKTWHGVDANQIEWVEDKKDIVLRFENLAKDFECVQELLGCNKPLPHINKTSHNYYKDYYDDETKGAVAKMFERDIDMFGYTF